MWLSGSTVRASYPTIHERMNPDMSRLKLLAAIAVLGIPLAACEEATPPPPVGSIVGTVSIEGTGIDGVSVNLSNGNTTTTAGGGSYRFDNVEGGAYTVTISGFPSDATFDATSAAATISSPGQSVTVNFSGAYIRTASVMGTVTVENMGLPGVTVTLTGVSDATAVTDDGGQYVFTGLRMGNYSVEISGFDSDEVGFSATAAAVTVGVGESKIVSFDGTYLRTAGIMGRVSVEGEGLEGVTVSLSGGPDGADETTMTDAAGQYSFAKLRAGDYAVGISGYDTDDYEFEMTSQNVTVALGETANVPFEGVLLRTSGVSGRVSVEGIGLADVMVTLSMADAEDMTAMTDAGGLYAFSGLAAGDYTVAIMLSDEQMAAYVFDMTSMDVTVGDDETEIVNFEAEHAATASVTVSLFIDEGTKNDMMDEGEMAFPTPELLAILAQLPGGASFAWPIQLAGPGVHDMQNGTLMPDGSLVFANLKAGAYQLVVSDLSDAVKQTFLASPNPALRIIADLAHGGSATGYPIPLTVGQAAMQNVPLDITHTTVAVAVTLNAGEDYPPGEPIPGAMVTLYADEDGEDKVGEGTTMANEEGHAYTSIRFERADTEDNTVYMGVSADGYWMDPTAEMQEVTWNPMSPVHPMPGAMPPAVLNEAIILNVNVDVMFGGATIETGYGGGGALAGWVIGIKQGADPTALETVTGDDVPTMLGADGTAAFMATVMPTDLPAVYHFGVAPDQPDALDGGESYEGTPVTYTHTGLSLAGTMDAGTIEVKYTTQSLAVYVHHERDQVHGYTGNVLGGDVRASGMVDLSVRYIDDAGRSRSFTTNEWNAARNTVTSANHPGVTLFTGLPADAKIIVQAEVASDTAGNPLPIMLLDPDELATYTALKTNGVFGGAFGDMGGFSHTVLLCPLVAIEPVGQDHGKCGSFAFVNTHTVSGLVWKRDVVRSGDDFLERGDGDPGTRTGAVFVPGITVSLDPVPGKNLAGDPESATTTERPVRTRGESSRGTEVLDETHQFDFGAIAAGVYELGVPDGWRARMGAKGTDVMLGNALDPLAGDVSIDVTPATGTVYGSVTGSDDFGLDSVTVTVNNVTAMTDALGRYIAEGVSPVRGKVFFSTSRQGYSASKPDSTSITFAANTTIRHDVEISGVAKFATVSGTVTASGTGAGIANVFVWVEGRAPLNPNARTRGSRVPNVLVTDADGSFTAEIPAQPLGRTSRIHVSKSGMSFQPTIIPVPSHAGSNVSGITFTGFLNANISGRVVAPGGGPMMGVKIWALPVGATSFRQAADTMTTGVTGSFTLNVPFGNYNMYATEAEHTFSYPNNIRSVNVGPGQNVNYGDIQAMTFGALNVMAVRQRTADDAGTANIDESERLDGQIRVSWDANDSTAIPSGYEDVVYTVQVNSGTGGAFESANATAATDTAGLARFAAPGHDTTFMVRVEAVATDTQGTLDPDTIFSTVVTVAAVDPSATGVMARRQAAADSDEGAATGNFIQASWSAVTNDNSDFRMVVEVTPASVGSTVWVVLVESTANDRAAVSAEIEDTYSQSLPVALPSGTGASVTVTAAELRAAIKVAIESVQGTADTTEDGPKWTRSDPVSVVARAAS